MKLLWMSEHLRVVSPNTKFCLRWLFLKSSNIHTLHCAARLFRNECNQAFVSIHLDTLNIWLTGMLNLLWSAVYHKNCHLVSRNPHIRATPLLIWKIHSKTHQQQRDEEIVKVLQQDCSKFCTSEDSFSIQPSLRSLCFLQLFLHYLLCTFPSLNPFSFSLLLLLLCTYGAQFCDVGTL